MSIEKLDFQKATKEQIPYTLISTKVIQSIKDPVAGFIWIYLASLPPDWLVNKEQVMAKFHIGDNRLKVIFSYLHRAGLIQYKRDRFDDGKLGVVIVHVLCGDQFKPDEPYILSTGMKTIPVDKTTGMKTRRVENQTCGSVGLQKKEYTKYNKDLLKKKIKEKREKLPLSHCFFPDQQSFQFLNDKNITRDMAEHGFEKFKEYYSGGEHVDDDWQKRFRVWMLREKNYKETY